MQVDALHLYLKCHSSTGVSKHFASKHQLPGFYISGKLVENVFRANTKLVINVWETEKMSQNLSGLSILLEDIQKERLLKIPKFWNLSPSLFALVCFRAPPPPPRVLQGTFALAWTHPLPLNFNTCEI